MIRVTDNAVKQLHHLLRQDDLPQDNRGLRILVAKGGCAGMEYQMKIDQPSEGDAIITHEGAEFYIDTESQAYLSGCIIDYSDGLTDAGFKIENPNAMRSCGCGTSFEPKAIDSGTEH
ncbi:MAG: iron-sulfur cluster assembly accessory protein [Verrucomicrobiales bacterium]|nr:iron-sulfur cluster assembly accessory protein [Verrucomicrobiales bacterium]